MSKSDWGDGYKQAQIGETCIIGNLPDDENYFRFIISPEVTLNKDGISSPKSFTPVRDFERMEGNLFKRVA